MSSWKKSLFAWSQGEACNQWEWHFGDEGLLSTLPSWSPACWAELRYEVHAAVPEVSRGTQEASATEGAGHHAAGEAEIAGADLTIPTAAEHRSVAWTPGAFVHTATITPGRTAMLSVSPAALRTPLVVVRIEAAAFSIWNLGSDGMKREFVEGVAALPRLQMLVVQLLLQCRAQATPMRH